MAWNSKDSEGFVSGKKTSIYASTTTQNFNQLKADLLYWRSYRSMSNPSSTVGNVTSQQKTDNNQINGLVTIATYGSDNLRYQSASDFPSFSSGDGDRILEDHYNKIKLQINDLKNLVGCSSCSTTCSYDCSVTCGDSCASGCSSGCSRTCDSSCSGNCYSGCSGCQGSCDGGCKGCGGCDGSCSGGCKGGCNGCGGCGGCGGRCGDGCGSSCAGNGCGSSG